MLRVDGMEATTATETTLNLIKNMNSHNEIAASHFNKKTLRSLAKKGLYIVQSTFLPGANGCYSNGETAYVISNGQIKTYLQVLSLA